eukprot:1270910-Amorphochlora_amoeboformis.AAC.5
MKPDFQFQETIAETIERKTAHVLISYGVIPVSDVPFLKRKNVHVWESQQKHIELYSYPGALTDYEIQSQLSIPMMIYMIYSMFTTKIDDNGECPLGYKAGMTSGEEAVANILSENATPRSEVR